MYQEANTEEEENIVRPNANVVCDFNETGKNHLEQEGKTNETHEHSGNRQQRTQFTAPRYADTKDNGNERQDAWEQYREHPGDEECEK